MPENFAARHAFAITPSDTIALASIPDRVYVGAAGAIVGRTMDSSVDVTFSAVPVGAVLPARFQYIRATGTTASALIGMAD